MDPLGVIDHLALDTQQKSFIDLAMPFEKRKITQAVKNTPHID
jgi:hypothetical protein